MKWITEWNPNLQNILSYTDTYTFIGSCFSEHIARKFSLYGFECSNLSLGTLYNPQSILNALDLSFLKENLILENQGYWSNLLSTKKYKTKDEAIKDALFLEAQTHDTLLKTNVLIITLGTAKIYKFKECDTIVTNCHKLPQNLFDSDFMSVEVIVEGFSKSLAKLFSNYPINKIILTVSPVRHTKDTLPINSLSKAILIQSAHLLTQKFDNVYYFPSFEIMIDELRDYRFYEADLIHPNAIAINYIWEKFKIWSFNQEIINQIAQIEKIQSFLNHKPTFVENASYQHKLASIEVEIGKLKDVSENLKSLFIKQINTLKINGE